MYELGNTTWQEWLLLAVRKKDYEKEVLYWANMPFHIKLGNLRLWIKFKMKIKDPFPGLSSEGLSLRYVNAFHEKYPDFSHRRILMERTVGENDTLWAALRYNTSDCLPVLTVTYYEDGTAWTERTKFLKGGGRELVPTGGYMREITIDRLPERPSVPELCLLQKMLPGIKNEISTIMAKV